MGDLSTAQLFGLGLSSIAGGASIASGIQGKNASQQALALQQQGLNQANTLGNQSSVLGLAQLDLQRQLADRQISLANQVLGETQPFRNRILGTEAPTTSAAAPLPTRTFTSTPFTATPAERDTLEAQFRNARENTLANSPVRGGGLGASLLNLEMGRAGAVTGLESDLSRRNQELTNATALTNFQSQLDTDRFNATDAINVRNMNFSSALADRQMAGQIGFGAPGVALPALANAGAAFSPSAAGAVFGPALAANNATLGASSQNFAAGTAQSTGSGQALGSLAAAGKLASSKQARGGNTGGAIGGGFGKG